MTQLKQIPVLFNQEEHTYTNTETGEMLKGITSTLIHRLFPDKYSGIPQAVLARAAERGTAIHEEIELVETIGIAPSTEEGRNYIKLKEEHALNFLESEYTVSDLEHYATNIDAIYEVEENVVDIADFKTTACRGNCLYAHTCWSSTTLTLRSATSSASGCVATSRNSFQWKGARTRR